MLSSSPTRAADECLAAPNSPAPPGSHWYYRSERSTQHKCWYVRQEDRQDQSGSSKVQQAETSSAATSEPPKASRQTERAHGRPATFSDKVQAEAVSETSEPTAVAAAALSAVDEQAAALDKTALPSPPSPRVVSDPGASASVIDNSGPAPAVSVKGNAPDGSPAPGQSATTGSAPADSSSQAAIYRADATATSTARVTTSGLVRVLLLIPAALALIGVLAFAVLPSRLRRRIYTGRWSASSDAINAPAETSPRFNHAIAEPNRPAPQVGMSDELKRNLRQVLQTLEAQLRGEVELNEAPLQRRSSKPAWG
jgi:hypothetical protein